MLEQPIIWLSRLPRVTLPQRLNSYLANPPLAKFLFVFLDGVGLGEAHEANPFTPTAHFEPTPFLRELLGVPFLQHSYKEVAHEIINKPNLLFKPVDASLGMPGLPQSATGQTSLYTGRNAPAFMGRHVTGFANGTLRILIEESGMFKQVLEAGGTATLANLYGKEYFEAIERRRIRYSVGTLLNLTANLPFRMPPDFAEGRALFWDITGEIIWERGVPIDLITPSEAGQRLANIAADYNLTLFECYSPDFAGHAQDKAAALAIIDRVDRFLQSLITHLPPDVTLIISSDHGNIEDLSCKTHTLNAVPLLVYGQNAPDFRSVSDIMGIKPVILHKLNTSFLEN